MKCPKCGEQLKLIHFRGGDFYGHTYSLAHMTTDKPMCDYSKAVLPAKEVK